MEKKTDKLQLLKQEQSEDLMKSLEDSLESPGEKKKRIISLYIVHLSMLVMAMGNGILITGIYPYIISVSIILLSLWNQYVNF